jgi:hypothetical protein
MPSLLFFKDLILGSTQRLTETSRPTRDSYWKVKAAGAGAETFLCRSSISPTNLSILIASLGLCRNSFFFTFIFILYRSKLVLILPSDFSFKKRLKSECVLTIRRNESP